MYPDAPGIPTSFWENNMPPFGCQYYFFLEIMRNLLDVNTCIIEYMSDLYITAHQAAVDHINWEVCTTEYFVKIVSEDVTVSPINMALN